MATTTQQASSKTTTTYNKDYSAADAYKDQMTTPEYEVAKQDTIDDYATGQGVDYTYKEADLANQYQYLQDQALENTLYGIEQSQNNYNQSLNDTNRSVIDALRSETASAIANGTSRGVTDANVLKSILGLQQESVADATELAQQYGQAYKDYGEDSAQAWIDANAAAANYQNQLLADTLTKQQTAQTSLDNKYTADAQIAAQQAETYGDLLGVLASLVTSEQTDSSATTTEPNVSSGSTTTSNTTDKTNKLIDTAYEAVTNKLSSGLPNSGSSLLSGLSAAVAEAEGKEDSGSKSTKTSTTLPTKDKGGAYVFEDGTYKINGKTATKRVEEYNPKGNGTRYKYYDSNGKLVYTTKWIT